MQVFGLDAVESLLEEDGYFFKLVAHDHVVFFFRHTTEHREAKVAGLSYEDDSAGNALAATVVPGRIEFRHHKAFSDERVRRIGRSIINHAEVTFARGFAIKYQGRELISAMQQ